MKFTVEFENGMQLSLQPKNIELVSNNDDQVILITRTDMAIVPLLLFPNLRLCTPEEIKARDAQKAVNTKAEAALAELKDAPKAALPTP
jgi:ABC-type uncharacterized transport system YnjBCD ATPase subunit